ncbi:hypothetical protein M426DRAFT_16809 [Hypoxylon sp. CI-4A]|nr:hypothetical protein M426DRAFT_16809 [Hypoxylon sp. CI-4A]
MDSLYLDIFGDDHPHAPDESPESDESWYNKWEVPCSKCKTRRGKLCWRCCFVLRMRGGEDTAPPEPAPRVAGSRSSCTDTEASGLEYLGLTRLVAPQPQPQPRPRPRPVAVEQRPDPNLSRPSRTLTFDNRRREQSQVVYIVAPYSYPPRSSWEEDYRYRPRYSCGEECRYRPRDSLEKCSCCRCTTGSRGLELMIRIVEGYLRYRSEQRELVKRRSKLTYHGIGLGGMTILQYNSKPYLQVLLIPLNEDLGSRIWSIISAQAIRGYTQGAKLLGYDVELWETLRQLD